MKNEKNETNENVPAIDPALHERLCAYVFGELAGAERAAFEAELLRAPALRREHERLTATIGLVRRAVPDEGLSEAVRRELLASARRSRFRFLRGRRLLQLAAACVVLVGGAFALRWMGSGEALRPAVLDGSQTARALPASEAQRRKAPESAGEEARFAAKELGSASDSRPVAPPAYAEVPQALRGLGYVGESATAPSAPPELVALEARSNGAAAAAPSAPEVRVEAQLAAIGASVGHATVLQGNEPAAVGAGGGAGGRLGGKVVAERRARAELHYVGPGDSVPPTEGVELLDALGYIGAHEDDATRRPSQALPQREPAPGRDEVVAQVESLLAACRLAPGESPRAMFFRYFGDAPFVLALEERTSTFAVDVDTASYALARAYLLRGELPPRAAVRTEEFVNYFKADQPPPGDGQPFAIGLELAPSPFGGDPRAEMLRVTVRSRDVRDFERQPLNLTLVIDTSGSMQQGGRLELVKRALALLLRELRGSDSVAIVKFNNQAGVVTRMVPAAQRGVLESLIGALPTEGGTNVEAGLRLGYELALESLARNAVNRVVLCSDGVGNIGETSARGLLALVEDARKKGIYLNTVGVGMGNHDDAFLEELADKGDGLCSYVDSDAEAKRVFVDGLASLVQPIARDVKIQVELDPAEVESWRLLGYENRALRTQDFKNDAIDAGEVNAGHQVSALYELVRRPSTGGPLATVRVRYKPPFAIDQGQEGEHARAEAERALELERTLAGSAVLPGFAAASDGYQRAVLVAQFAEVLRRSVHARQDSFAILLVESRRLAKALGDPDFAEFVTLLERANALLDARAREETPRVQELLDELGRLHYEQALRERKRELAAQAGEPERSEEAQREAELVEQQARQAIERLEAELRGEIYRARGIEPPDPETLRALENLGYGDEGD